MKATDTKRTLEEIEVALATSRELDWRRNLVVFNVNGMSADIPFQHEMDMCIVTKSGYVTEVEIKRSLADFRADLKKRHGHRSYNPGRFGVKEFWYCIPESVLEHAADLLAEHGMMPTGFITYDEKLKLRFRRTVRESVTENRTYEEPGTEPHKGIDLRRYVPMKEIAEYRDMADGYDSFPLFIEQRLALARLAAMHNVTYKKKIIELEKKCRTTRKPGENPWE